MFLVRLYLFVCVNLFLYTHCSIPVERLCANPTCEEPISKAQGSVQYASPSTEVLSFKKGQEITIVSKSKNAKDYWGALIEGKFGYVPSHLIKEVKIFHSMDKLIPVYATKKSLEEENLPQNDTLNKIPFANMEKNNSNLPQPTESVISNQVLNNAEKLIKPNATFKIIEGTTIFADEPDEITPSSTIDEKSAGQTVNPLNSKTNEKVDTQKRATIPPEVINLNANYMEQKLNNKTGFVIENVKENDENAVVETKEINAGDDEEEEEEEEDDEDAGDDDKDDEDDEEEELTGKIKNQFTESQSSPEKEKVVTDENKSNKEKKELEGNMETNDKLEVIKAASTESILLSNKEGRAQTVVNVESSVTSKTSASTSSSEAEAERKESAGVLSHPSPHNEGLNKIDESAQEPPRAWSMLNGLKENLPPPVEPSLKNPSQTTPGGFDVKYENHQGVVSEPPGLSLNSQVKLETQEMPPEPQEKIPESKEQEKLYVSQAVHSELQGKPSGPEVVFSPAQNVKNETPSTSQQTVSEEFTGASVLQQEASFAPLQNITDEKSHEGISSPAQEVPAEAFGTTPQPAAFETSMIFNKFSVSADSLPEDLNNNVEKRSLTPEEKMELTTEGFLSSPIPTESVDKFSDPPQTLKHSNPESESTVEKVQEASEGSTEASVTPSVLPQVVTEEFKVNEDTSRNPGWQEETSSTENVVEEPGMLSQITGMFSSWFTSTPERELSSQNEGIEEAAFHDIQNKKYSEINQKETFNKFPSAKCPNADSSDCLDSSSEEQSSFWGNMISSGLDIENILTPNSTFIYLVVTAVTVLLFTLGHNIIEKKGKTGPLIAKINKLEHEFLVSSKECLQLKDEVLALREKIVLYENSANDELVLSLQSELEESKKIRSELELSIELLQQELDAATEAGLDLNKMLSEVLTQKGGSESLLKSVESLQAQLDSQQKVIDEMTKKLGVKNQENEALQTALDAANDKSESLEEELGDLKHNLNLHLKEKEDLAKDFNSQMNQMKTRINQLGETKEKEISKLKKELEEVQKKLLESSGALTVKEEELKALKDSMKNLKGKGDIKLETVFDVSRVKGELAKEVKENKTLMEKLQKEETSKKALEEQTRSLDEEMQKLKKGYEEAELRKDEAEKKLEVLSTYFKEKETQLQKELGLQEALWAQKKGDEKAVYNMMKSLQEEVDSYKSQNETLKQEILDQERGFKNQLATLEQKAHENWVAARQAERKLEESKQELAQLRNRLTLIEKNNSNAEGKGNLRSSEELNGVEAASPILHDTSSPLLFPPLPLDPNSSSLLPPGFMPPPIFMPPPMGGFIPPPPFLPGDRRPPPLGRMSSPPLNNRFSPSSPADYTFERMSSPPLSPPGSNYRSQNDDREHFRHRTPPFPPPLHPRNWNDSNEMPGFIPISSQRDSRRDHKGSNVSSEHSSSDSLDKSSRHSGRV